METLKIGFVDFWAEWNDEDFITPILKKHFNVIVDQNNPNVLFHSIFGGMKEAYKYKCKKILFIGENYRSKHFNSDYSISFDLPNETNFRLPLWQAYLLLRPELKNQLFNKTKHTQFKRFCSFTVSNPSNTARNNIFDQLSIYRKVNSYGKVRMNDFGLKKESQGKYWRDAKYKFFLDNTHKFSITYENTSYPYYCTEKIMDAFLAGSIPIYWGDPKVAEDWNEKAFINMNNTNMKWPVWVDEIKKLDQDEAYFIEKYNEPVFADEQKDKLINNLGEFENWLIKKIKLL